MRFLYNDPFLKERRRKLRNNMPKAEILLWVHLRKSQLGVRFFRQYGVGPYVLDFYCPRSKLAIELDGDSHFSEEAIRHDRRRDLFLKQYNIKTVRFINNEIYESLDWVVESIKREIGGYNSL